MKCLWDVCFLLLMLSNVVNSSNVKMTVVQQRAECQHALDMIRQNHNVPKLTFGESLEFSAQEWALSMALRQRMQIDQSFTMGENVFRSYSAKASCVQAINSWYQGIQNYDFNNPKWSTSNGGFIQMVLDSNYQFGIGIVVYKGSTYIVGRFSKSVTPYDGFLKSNVKHPVKDLSESDLRLKNPPTFINKVVDVPTIGGFTDYFPVSSACSVKCGKGTVLGKRYCIRAISKRSQICQQDTSRTKDIPCDGKDCSSGSSCTDIDENCFGFAILKNYCDDSRYEAWMKKNCAKSCNYCKNPCENTHKDCDRYAHDKDKMYCKEDSIYLNWMKQNCRKSCSFCS